MLYNSIVVKLLKSANEYFHVIFLNSKTEIPKNGVQGLLELIINNKSISIRNTKIVDRKNK